MASRFFTPNETVVRELPDGRLQQVAVKGVPVSLTDAIFYEILTDKDFEQLGMQKPTNYGTRFMGVKPSDQAGASRLTTSTQGQTVFARAETDPASGTTTIVPAETPETASQPSTGAASGLTSTAGDTLRQPSR